MTFGFCDGSRNFRKLFSVSSEMFVLHDSVHVGHQTFLLEVELRQCVFCKDPCHIGSQADFAISDFWEVSINTVLP